MNKGSGTLTDTENQCMACAPCQQSQHTANAVKLDGAHVQYLYKAENVTGATVA